MGIIIGAFIYLALVIGLIYGWVLNIIWLFNKEVLVSSGEIIISIIGILIVPLGSIMGLFVH